MMFKVVDAIKETVIYSFQIVLLILFTIRLAFIIDNENNSIKVSYNTNYKELYDEGSYSYYKKIGKYEIIAY